MDAIQDVLKDKPSAASPGDYPPLAIAIGRATGERHEILSDLIIKAMPNALPPKYNNTRLYFWGIYVYGVIYLAFEASWKGYLDSPSSSDQPHDEALRTFLKNVRPKGLERTPRLSADIGYLMEDGEDDKGGRVPSREDIVGDPEGPIYNKFKRHIAKVIEEKPHVLYSYAWCMYMAVFAGGYYIRAELAKIDEHFWRRHGWKVKDDSANAGATSALDRYGYSFLSFDVDEKQLQQDFKVRLFGAEDILTAEERDDIIEESKNIFDLSIELVKEMSQRIRLRPKELEQPTNIAPPTELPTYSETMAHLPSYFDANYGDFEKGIPANDIDGLLTQEATEEEYREWRAEAAPMRRGPLFWTQMVLLVLILSFIFFGMIFGIRWWAWRRSLQFEDDLSKSQGGRPCLGGFFW